MSLGGINNRGIPEIQITTPTGETGAPASVSTVPRSAGSTAASGPAGNAGLDALRQESLLKIPGNARVFTSAVLNGVLAEGPP